MTHLKTLSLRFAAACALAVFGLAGAASAQTALTQTTLSAAVTSTAARFIQVASPTNIVPGTQLYIDDEVLFVTAATGTQITVRRGANGTRSRTHLAASNIYVIPAALIGALIDYPLGGSCPAGSYPATPMIDYLDATTFQCVNGQWSVQSTAGQQHLPVTLAQTTAYSNATTTFSNLSALSFPVVGNHTYTAACSVVYQASATTAGPKFQVTGPASPATVLFAVDGGNGAATYADAAATAFSSAVTALGTAGATGTNYVAHLNLSVVNGVNAGTVQIQAAANGAGTLTIQPGSFCIQQ